MTPADLTLAERVLSAPGSDGVVLVLLALCGLALLLVTARRRG